jgi:hypothetical protein
MSESGVPRDPALEPRRVEVSPGERPDQGLIDALREGATVLDEPFHREAIAEVMLRAADALASRSTEIPREDGTQ